MRGYLRKTDVRANSLKIRFVSVCKESCCVLSIFPAFSCACLSCPTILHLFMISSGQGALCRARSCISYAPTRMQFSAAWGIRPGGGGRIARTNAPARSGAGSKGAQAAPLSHAHHMLLKAAARSLSAGGLIKQYAARTLFQWDRRLALASRAAREASALPLAPPQFVMECATIGQHASRERGRWPSGSEAPAMAARLASGLRLHRQSAVAAHAGCQALAKLCFSLDESGSHDSRPAVEAAGFDCVVTAMFTHADDTAVQTWGCGALWRMSFASADAAERAGAAGAVESVALALRRHVDSLDCQWNGCAALACLVRNSAVNQAAAAAAGSMELMVAAMRMYPSAGVQYECCAVLSAMLQGRPPLQERARVLGAPAVVRAAKARHAADANLVASAELALQRMGLEEAAAAADAVAAALLAEEAAAKDADAQKQSNGLGSNRE